MTLPTLKPADWMADFAWSSVWPVTSGTSICSPEPLFPPKANAAMAISATTAATAATIAATFLPFFFGAVLSDI